MMRTCSRLSPSAPRYCICQHALWSTHLPSGSCEDNEASIGMETSAFSMYFHRRYSARLIIWPLPPLYMNTPNWSRINSSTAYWPPTLKASIKSPPVVRNWEILIKFSSRRLYCRKWISLRRHEEHVWWNVCFWNVNPTLAKKSCDVINCRRRWKIVMENSQHLLRVDLLELQPRNMEMPDLLGDMHGFTWVPCAKSPHTAF